MANARPDTASTAASTGLRRELAAVETDAHGLADRLPDLVVEAERIAATVAHGIHGRRRAGPGDTFWQFRPYGDNDSASAIDWRRSASSDQVFVREREWEAAHTIWMWPDLSASMRFRSHLSNVTKRDRALVLTLASAEILVRGGERVAILGLSQPTATRHAARKFAEAIARAAGATALDDSLPPSMPLSRFSGVLLFGDFLDPLPQIRERLQAIAGSGVTGHLVQVLDPAEETLPYQGRTEFVGLEGSDRWIAERAESLRDAYVARLGEHREGLREIIHRLGWSFLLHHTDRPAAEPLLSLIVRMQGKDLAAGFAPASPAHEGRT